MSLFERAKKARENKKGFTLVELIVVLVILAILAAIMVPQLTGYIDKAKNKQYEVRCRNILIAAQTLVDEEYALAGSGATGTSINTSYKITANNGSKGENLIDVIITLAEEKDATISDITVGAKYKITKLNINFSNPTKYASYVDDGTDKGWTIQDTAFTS